MTLPFHFGRVFTGSEGGQSRPADDIPRILGQLASTNTDCSEFISHRAVLKDIDQVVAAMRSGEVIHAVATP